MKTKLRAIPLLALLSLAAVAAWAEGSPLAVVEYASGTDVIIIRAGKRLMAKDPIGVELVEGDQIQTGDGVFLEIAMRQGGAVVKLAENTTFVLERLASGKASLLLVYGRVRAKVDKIAGTDEFSIRSQQATAGVRGTDFGIDVVAAPRIAAAAASTVTKAYCFEGAIAVTTYVKTGTVAEDLESLPKTVVVDAGEMVVVQGPANDSRSSEATIEQAIEAFWTENDYVSETTAEETSSVAAAPGAVATGSPGPGVAPGASGTPVAPAGGYDLGYAAGLAEARAELAAGAPALIGAEELDALRKRSLVQRGGLLAGGVLALGGAATAITGLVMMDQGAESNGLDLLRLGAVLSASSIPFLTITLLYNP